MEYIYNNHTNWVIIMYDIIYIYIQKKWETIILSTSIICPIMVSIHNWFPPKKMGKPTIIVRIYNVICGCNNRIIILGIIIL